MGDQMGLQESFNTKPLYVSDNISYNMSDEDEVLDIIFNSMSDFCEPKTKYEEGIPGHIHNYKKQSTIPTTPTQKKIPLTGAERIKKLREKRSEEEIKQNKATDQVRKAAKRKNMSDEQKKQVRRVEGKHQAAKQVNDQCKILLKECVPGASR